MVVIVIFELVRIPNMQSGTQITSTMMGNFGGNIHSHARGILLLHSKEDTATDVALALQFKQA